MPLFAETDAGTGFLFAACTLLGGAVAWVSKTLWDWRALRRKESQEDEQTAVGRLEKLLERVDRDRVELREDVRKLEFTVEQLTERATRAEIKSERAVVWIRHLEAALDARKIPHAKWADNDPTGSRPMPALPATGDDPAKRNEP